jgi:hypothetical protein
VYRVDCCQLVPLTPRSHRSAPLAHRFGRLSPASAAPIAATYYPARFDCRRDTSLRSAFSEHQAIVLFTARFDCCRDTSLRSASFSEQQAVSSRQNLLRRRDDRRSIRTHRKYLQRHLVSPAEQRGRQHFTGTAASLQPYPSSSRATWSA